jgi:hypothetical protein
MSMLMYMTWLFVGVVHRTWLLLSGDCDIEGIGKVLSERGSVRNRLSDL